MRGIINYNLILKFKKTTSLHEYINHIKFYYQKIYKRKKKKVARKKPGY
jgi:hypothetical protein